jgi:hypothetical protein
MKMRQRRGVYFTGLVVELLFQAGMGVAHRTASIFQVVQPPREMASSSSSISAVN